MSTPNINDLISKLEKELPPIWERPQTTALTGGAVNSRTLANLMSAGHYPALSYRLGRKVIIDRDAFLSWLAARLRVNAIDGQAEVDTAAGISAK